jgi:Flp pilus assembly protein TadG
MKTSLCHGKRQSGAVAIIAALSLPVLIGFAGLALDLGHLYVEKTELQNATDACALAASRELTCAAAPCAASFLDNAVASGRAVAARNNVNFQSAGVDIAPGDIKFATTFLPNSNPPNFGYVSQADANSALQYKYVMCTARQTGIIPWFMQVLGAGSQSVSAQAVATLAPAQANCAIPIGLCMSATGTPTDPYAGLVVGDWTSITSTESGKSRWVDFTPPGGGAHELALMFTGTGGCNVPPPGSQVGEPGTKTSLEKAWNTRFGLYKGGDTISSAPPDYTGYAYTATSWPLGRNAYSGTSPNGAPNFLSARANHSIFQGDSSGITLQGGYTYSTAGQLTSLGSDRRLVTVPVVECPMKNERYPVRGYACALMLHPIEKDDDEPRIEYLGKSSDSNSPCATSGAVGGPNGVGPKVPALMQ